MKVSVIVPTLNEGQVIETLLTQLQPLRQAGHQLIVCDGGSSDDTLERAKPWVDAWVVSGPGRALQMNTGAAQAHGDLLWFVHADTDFPQGVGKALEALLRLPADRHWARFTVCLDAPGWRFRLIEQLMDWRSCLTGIATGDQAWVVRRNTFQQLQGFAEIPLMEDIEMSRRLRRLSRPLCLAEKVKTSARRWQRHGIWRTVLLMWRLRLAYFLGASPDSLAREYRQCSSPTPES